MHFRQEHKYACKAPTLSVTNSHVLICLFSSFMEEMNRLLILILKTKKYGKIEQKLVAKIKMRVPNSWSFGPLGPSRSINFLYALNERC